MLKEIMEKKKVQVKKGKNNRKMPKVDIPADMFTKCPGCGKGVYRKDVESAKKTCPNCGKLFRMSAVERIALIADEGTYVPFKNDIKHADPLGFPEYEAKLSKAAAASGLPEAVVSGKCEISGEKAIICVMESKFMMGSMGSVVGEILTSAIEEATERRHPVIIFTASGGARMQEGMVSLMQMAKVSGALAKHNEAGLLYITVLTDPTTGGVTASFASLGDIILAEKGALVGFAGRRVIEQTIRQKLPENFQSAEFLLERGFIDAIVDRDNQKEMLAKLLKMHK
ncbi:MAG: acetyl-CoA carboxylase, carboxyltransferase subunit beta [Clostridiales bacterium]|jgi:acetyl-CoA carboxylase carboxyl transferase subunit beta|nr:acetyl-CoA carboxylase, carboxyltransferase subunit beta [Clostridiales bacterium]